MTKQQRMIVILLGILNGLFLLCIAAVIIWSVQANGPIQQTAAVTPSPTLTPTPTIPPTWTPVPTPTPAVEVLPTPTPRPLTAEETAMLDEIEAQVIVLRGLEARRDVPRTVLPGGQLRQRVESMVDDPEWSEQIRRLKVTLNAYGLLERDADLGVLWREVLGEQVAGFYDTEDETIYLVSDSGIDSAVDRLTFVHEFGHALQDQHFDLQALGLEQADRPQLYTEHLGAGMALLEGDAELLQVQYLEQVFTPGDLIEYQQAVARAPHVRFDATPRVLRESFLFPYRYGLVFATTLYEEGGWELVNSAYITPPVSSEQILHPELYLEGELPVEIGLPPLERVLGEEWAIVHEGAMGEFFLRLYLENWLDPTAVVTATEGWGGDYSVVYANEATGESLLVLRVVGDTPADNDEFLSTYLAWAEARYGGPGNARQGQVSCWQGLDALCVTLNDEGVTIVSGSNLALVETVWAGLFAE